MCWSGCLIPRDQQSFSPFSSPFFSNTCNKVTLSLISPSLPPPLATNLNFLGQLYTFLSLFLEKLFSLSALFGILLPLLPKKIIMRKLGEKFQSFWEAGRPWKRERENKGEKWIGKDVINPLPTTYFYLPIQTGKGREGGSSRILFF